MPGEPDALARPLTVPSKHVVVLGGGKNLSRAVALECVRRGADVTVLAAESDALTSTYELMKTTSLERQAHVKQQLRCSPLELADGPMACFVALQNVLELVGRIDCFVCHPAELLLEAKGEADHTTLSDAQVAESVLCCLWAVRAVMFPMQRQASGRVMILGNGPPAATDAQMLSYRLAIQQLGRSLRAELSASGIPMSLAAPLGATPEGAAGGTAAATTSAEAGAGARDWLVDGSSGAPLSHGEYARHAVDGMLDGVPYILPSGTADQRLRFGLGARLGYNRLWAVQAILQAFMLPLLSLVDLGVPTMWRESAVRWRERLRQHMRADTAEAAAARDGFEPLKEYEA